MLRKRVAVTERHLERVSCMLQDPSASYEPDALDGHIHLKRGTGGSFSPAAALRPGQLLPVTPEMIAF